MEPNGQEPKSKLDKGALISLSFELGYIIALPIAGFGLVGKWLDTRLHHEFPWITLIGIGLAITTTVIWLTRKLQKYIK